MTWGLLACGGGSLAGARPAGEEGEERRFGGDDEGETDQLITPKGDPKGGPQRLRHTAQWTGRGASGKEEAFRMT